MTNSSFRRVFAGAWVVLAAGALAFACGEGSGTSGGSGAVGNNGGSPQNNEESCNRNSDCDDGVFCNGSELCVDGSCQDQDPPCFSSQKCEEANSICKTACDTATDADGDGHDAINCGGDDCDDANDQRFPGNVEVCDDKNVDEDCDPDTFGSRDVDKDGYTDALCCNGDKCGDDCNDEEPTQHPTEGEVCDGLDNDCDGKVDEDIPSATYPRWYPDADGDGARTKGASGVQECVLEKVGYTLDATEDCDDEDDTVYPMAPELCDGKDNDCNPSTLGCVRRLLPNTITTGATMNPSAKVLADGSADCPSNMFVGRVALSTGALQGTSGPVVVSVRLTCMPILLNADTGAASYDKASGMVLLMLYDSFLGQWNALDTTESVNNLCTAGNLSSNFNSNPTCVSASYTDGSLTALANGCASGSAPVGIKLNDTGDSYSPRCATVTGAE